jgi:tRNA pseudouridine65 synthase
MPHEPTLLYLDPDLVAIDKPSGLSVHRGWAAEGSYAVDWVKATLGDTTAYPVHRLDRPTSGVLIFARSPEMARVLGATWTEGRVAKRYLALTRGITPDLLRLDHPVKDEDGQRRDAVTWFQRLWVFRNRYSLVECRPETGRTHQIRRHLKHLSCPIIGDANYGKSEHNRLFATEFGLTRLALHALTLTFAHPRTGSTLTLTAPVPDDFAGPLTLMGCPLTELIAALEALPAAGMGDTKTPSPSTSPTEPM